ncbi:MAG: hypothetical protein ACWGNV_11480 [Bacteroidales bacterium]
MGHRRSFSYIYNVQRIVLLIFYTTTAVALSIPLARLFATCFSGSFFPLAVSLVLYIVGVVVFGSFIHVVSYIPFNLATAFDPIKNDIASGRISTLEQLQRRLTLFTTGFFDFAFIDIEVAAMQLEGSKLVSHQETAGLETILDSYGMLEKSRQLESIIRAGRITLGEENYHLYILPIWFADQYLGYMALVSRKRISRFFQKFLMEYENNFLDDQIKIVEQLAHAGDRK